MAMGTPRAVWSLDRKQLGVDDVVGVGALKVRQAMS
jgi:hypothetical protein